MTNALVFILEWTQYFPLYYFFKQYNTFFMTEIYRYILQSWQCQKIGNKNYWYIFSNKNGCWYCAGCRKLYFQNCGIKPSKSNVFMHQYSICKLCLICGREEWDMMNLWVSWPTPCIQAIVNICVMWSYNNQEVQYPWFLSSCKEMKYMGK